MMTVPQQVKKIAIIVIYSLRNVRSKEESVLWPKSALKINKCKHIDCGK
jgi:hypothetical protein